MTVFLAIGVTTGLFLLLAAVLLLAERRLVNYGNCPVSVNDGDVAFDQPGGTTLLVALHDHKIFIPSACGGKGTCGYCKVTVLSGGGPVLPTETPYLSRGEIRAGVRLACQVKVKEAISLTIPEALLNAREYRARVRSVRSLTHDIKEINLDLIEPTDFVQHPGQYVQILVPSPEGPVFRAYSISSPAHETNVAQLHVRLVPGGIASTYLHALSEGEHVHFTGPFGDFRLSEDPETEIICVGGGCGMAPIANIIASLYTRWPERSCYLFFGCRTTRDVFYLDRWQAYTKRYPNFKFVYALSDPLQTDETWDGETGFIHQVIEKRLKPGVARQAFLCGPPPMIEAVTEVLTGKGVPPGSIFHDAF